MLSLIGWPWRDFIEILSCDTSIFACLLSTLSSRDRWFFPSNVACSTSDCQLDLDSIFGTSRERNASRLAALSSRRWRARTSFGKRSRFFISSGSSCGIKGSASNGCRCFLKYWKSRSKRMVFRMKCPNSNLVTLEDRSYLTYLNFPSAVNMPFGESQVRIAGWSWASRAVKEMLSFAASAQRLTTRPSSCLI